MNKKKLIIMILIALVVAVAVFIAMNMFNGKDEVKKKEEKKEEPKTTIVDYETYQELRSEVYENETFAILIAKTDDEISDTFREEILYSFKERKAKVYEIDTDKLTEAEESGVIRDVTDIVGYDVPTLITPTLLVSQNGKIVYVREGLLYSPDIIEVLNKNKIE